VRRRRTAAPDERPNVRTADRDDQSGTGDVSPHAAAARATDVSGLPPTFVDGSL
jgi:hypothetical protein